MVEGASVPKLKYDLALARQDGIIYGIPDDGKDGGKMFLIHGLSASKAIPGRDDLACYARIEKGTNVALKLTVDDGTPAGSRRVVVVVDGQEIFTGDWALQ
jgi:hypothetical protein